MKTSCKNCKHFCGYGWGNETPARWNSSEPDKFIPEFLGLSRSGGLMQSAGKCMIGNNRKREDGSEYLTPEDAFEEFEEGKGCEDWKLHPAYEGCTPEVMLRRLQVMMNDPDIRDSYRFDMYAAMLQNFSGIIQRSSIKLQEVYSNEKNQTHNSAGVCDRHDRTDRMRSD